MRDLNKAQIIGRLGADPEGKYTPQGSAVTTFRVAVGRQWKTEAGEQKEDTEWFTVVAWNKLAEICNQYLAKGSRVYIEGRMQTRSWDDQATGEKKYRTELIASDMIILDSRKDGDSAAPASPRQPTPPAGRTPAQRARQPFARPMPTVDEMDAPF